MAGNDSKKGLPMRTGKRKGKFAGYFFNTNMRKLKNLIRNEPSTAYIEKWAIDHNLLLEYLRLSK